MGSHRGCVAVVVKTMKLTSDSSIFESLRGLLTSAGFVASSFRRSALSPPSVTAGWSVCGKRDKSAIYVALSPKHICPKAIFPDILWNSDQF